MKRRLFGRGLAALLCLTLLIDPRTAEGMIHFPRLTYAHSPSQSSFEQNALVNAGLFYHQWHAARRNLHTLWDATAGAAQREVSVFLGAYPTTFASASHTNRSPYQRWGRELGVAIIWSSGWILSLGFLPLIQVSVSISFHAFWNLVPYFRLQKDPIRFTKNDKRYIVISSKGVGEKFEGHTYSNHQQIVQTAELPDATTYRSDTYLSKQGVRFVRGKSGSRWVWGVDIRETSVEVFAKKFSLKIRELDVLDLRTPRYFMISEPKLGERFEGHASDSKKKVYEQAKLPDPKTFQKPTYRSPQGIVYARGKTGTFWGWGIDLEATDLETFRITYGLEYKETDFLDLAESAYFAVSGPTLERHFDGDGLDMAARIETEATLPDPKTNRTPTYISPQGFVFHRGRVGNYWKWGIRLSDTPLDLFRQTFKLRPRAAVKVDFTDKRYFIVSHQGLGEAFERSRDDFHNHAKTILQLPDPNTYEPLTFVSPQGIEFIRGQLSGNWAWGMDQEKTSLDTLGGVIGLKRKQTGLADLAEEHFLVISEEGLTEHFIGSGRDIRVKIQPAQLPDAKTYTAPTYTSPQGIVFIRGKHGYPHWTWGVDLRQTSAETFAQAFNLRLRPLTEEVVLTFGLGEAAAVLGEDPLRFKQYLELYHPEIDRELIDDVVIDVNESLAVQWGREGHSENPHRFFESTLAALHIETPELQGSETDAHSVLIRGSTTPGIRTVQVTGNYTRKISVRNDGTFEARIPLPATGEQNTFELYALDEKAGQRGPTATLHLEQTSPVESTEEAYRRLLALREETMAEIQEDQNRADFLRRSVEETLLGRFTRNETEGFEYLQSRIQNERHPAMKTLLQAIHAKFKIIAATPYDLQPGMRLYFFQKYVIHETRELFKTEAPGVIWALEQGLGKTVTALAYLNSQEAFIVAPNSVVTTWVEQARKFFRRPLLRALDGTYAERNLALTRKRPEQMVTNVEYLRQMTEALAASLSESRENKGALLKTSIFDEADFLGSTSSQQSRGARLLKSRFKLLLTATPFTRISQIGKLLSILRPGDHSLRQGKAMGRAFKAGDAAGMKALFVLMRRYTIRIRKQDVFEEFDRGILLNLQKDRLPAKREIAPGELGDYEILPEQFDAIVSLLTTYKEWCLQRLTLLTEKKVVSTREDRKFAGFKEGFFSKLHALRQIMNDPAYFGRPDLPSPKHQKMDEIVDLEMKAPKGKVLIFCRYVEEVERYLARYAAHGAVGYYGDLPQNANGYKIGTEGALEYYQTDETGDYLLKEGRPIRASSKDQGKPIRALDYSRIVFQNNPATRIMVATYDSGSVGVTLTAAHAVIYSDWASTYRDQYQSGDRPHRIDNDRKKYEVRYYWLRARYPSTLLGPLTAAASAILTNGTFDEIQEANIRQQKRIFHRIMDGVGDTLALIKIQRRFLKARLPQLFETGKETPDEFSTQLTDESAVEDNDSGSTTTGLGGTVGTIILIAALLGHALNSGAAAGAHLASMTLFDSHWPVIVIVWASAKVAEVLRSRRIKHTSLIRPLESAA